MSQITLIQKTNQSLSGVESDAKNALSTGMSESWTEFAGLSWIFQKDDEI